MSASTLLFLLLLIGLPLAMMFMHRGRAGGGMGGCGMGHAGHGNDSRGHGDHERTAPTRPAGGAVDLSKSESKSGPVRDDGRGQRGGHGCC